MTTPNSIDVDHDGKEILVKVMDMIEAFYIHPMILSNYNTNVMLKGYLYVDKRDIFVILVT